MQAFREIDNTRGASDGSELFGDGTTASGRAGMRSLIKVE